MSKSAQPPAHVARIRLTIRKALIELENAAHDAKRRGDTLLARDVCAIANALKNAAELRLNPHGPIGSVGGPGPAKVKTPAGHPTHEGTAP
ncbi:hypothetical protein [Roseibium alexandrii]|uniref:Uncharacterized protein n=1 Tax=Roseibium alexandrii (strain DSM 17067 / NCIMB 14079 / DFL-11) TaxID=244592 RepID=A0A5E8UWQ8_ROSAD|nr:hypothetical protein [Roseibium alexandrii]RMX61878.1 hypothetical protein SADFL11_00046380 [Roseibium alexandrii DFL-11]